MKRCKGGTPGNSSWVGAAQTSKSWPYFRLNVNFHSRFQTWPLKFISVFVRNSWGWFVSSLLRLERQQKRFPKIHFELAYFSFFLLHLELIRRINTFIHARSFLENHNRFQTKMGSVNPFSDQNGSKTLGAAHTYMAYIRKYPPPPPPTRAKRLLIKSGFSFNVMIN